MDSRRHGDEPPHQGERLRHRAPAASAGGGRDANGHHAAIRCRLPFTPWQGLELLGERQSSDHRYAGHELTGGTAVVKKYEQGITLSEDGISNGATVATGSKEQPAVWLQLWDATAKGTATR